MVEGPRKGELPSPEECPPSKEFTEEEATAVNHLFGIEKKGGLKPEEFPPTIDLSEWWKTTKAKLDEHPSDRELFLGWDPANGKLEITEETEGQAFEDIEQAERYFGRTIEGRVTPKAIRLLNFHSHTEPPEELLPEPQTAIEQFLKDIPQTHWRDITKILVTEPNAYASIVVDTSRREEGVAMPVLVMFKTAESPVVTEANYWQYREKLEDLLREELLGFDRTRSWRELFGRKHRPRYMDILFKDSRWRDEFGLVIYRGFLSENIDEPQIIRRSDTRLER